MSMTIYESGSLVTTSAAYVNEAGAPTDPTVVTLKYKKDAGATTTVTYPSGSVIKDSTGAYHADLDTTGFTGPGLQQWFVEWTGTGAVTAIEFDAWKVRPALL
jgi:hypothetical protein